ncbi:Bug family tripartite tricarboxylate transporter substrate binding protein [Aquabacter spiritensis]|uniref:Tripartite-type tricarboxylate transporter receptor subunit TctC n=1 Tax=Aquabacter spiritensis TaxID=933073 RepID=A0A4V2UYJ6_9HYPH|nr:tripartite tricarboxylate transporter substrate binding protein [Aquabacter spiritensis]TCT07658.1 tripartite-type tricarboxylate transporter receptor subunit TctC [Aquabacter spiritensis]
MISRRFAAALGAALLLAPGIVAAQDAYPSRPIKMVVGFPAGSTTDVASRIVAQHMSTTLGQPVVVDNRPGASSNTAAGVVANGPADGYTLFVTTIANTINESLQPSAAVDLAKVFAPIAQIGSVPNILVVHPSLEVVAVPELIAAAKKTPGRITYASSGIGTSPHLSGELFSMMADIKMLHVPYKGSSPAVTDLLSGQVLVMFSPASTVLPHIKSGKLKALAVTSAKRTEAAPDLPTIAEFGLTGFETSVWFGLEAPKATPPDVIAKLSVAVAKAQQAPEVREQFKAQGIDIVVAGPEAFGRAIQSEVEKWAQVVKTAGIKAQ